jgi:hypothetical protein
MVLTTKHDTIIPLRLNSCLSSSTEQVHPTPFTGQQKQVQYMKHCVSQPFYLTTETDPVYETLRYFWSSTQWTSKRSHVILSYQSVVLLHGDVPHAYNQLICITSLRCLNTRGGDKDRVERGTSRNQPALNCNVDSMQICYCSARTFQLGRTFH